MLGTVGLLALSHFFEVWCTDMSCLSVLPRAQERWWRVLQLVHVQTTNEMMQTAEVDDHYWHKASVTWQLAVDRLGKPKSSRMSSCQSRDKLVMQVSCMELLLLLF